jgi:hypothetical protein
MPSRRMRPKDAALQRRMADANWEFMTARNDGSRHRRVPCTGYLLFPAAAAGGAEQNVLSDLVEFSSDVSQRKWITKEERRSG